MDSGFGQGNGTAPAESDLNAADRAKVGRLRGLLRWATGLALFLASSALFYSLSPFELRGGDRQWIIPKIGEGVVSFDYHTPLPIVLYQEAYRLWGARGLTAEAIMAVGSALSGGLFVLALLSFSRNPRFWVPCLATGSLMVFWGHVEVHAPSYAFGLWFMLLGIRYARGESRSAWPMCVAWFAACLCHMSNVFYLPALLSLVWQRGGKDVKPSDLTVIALTRSVSVRVSQAVKPIALTAIALSLIFLVAPLLLPSVNYHTLALERLVPLFRLTGPKHRFTLFSWAHVEIVVWFWFLASPLAPIGLVGGFRRGWRDKAWRFLAIASGCALFWTFLWNPDLGLDDWDLFCQCAVPLNVLTGWTLLLGHSDAQQPSLSAPPPSFPETASQEQSQ
ncbi:hypothetical protein FJY63_12475 [Candidatus Sumerlaeota bacterium]|nr:hypothetical protein [Candidatus Sumerlaeota bacterium]